MRQPAQPRLGRGPGLRLGEAAGTPSQRGPAPALEGWGRNRTAIARTATSRLFSNKKNPSRSLPPLSFPLPRTPALGFHVQPKGGHTTVVSKRRMWPPCSRLRPGPQHGPFQPITHGTRASGGARHKHAFVPMDRARRSLLERRACFTTCQREAGTEKQGHSGGQVPPPPGG